MNGSSRAGAPSTTAENTNDPTNIGRYEDAGLKNAEHENAISRDEVALYDRQIRLWGMQAQENIRKANILLISIRALADEVAKNLVLAGIGSLTVMDHEVVTEHDLETQFLISSEDVGKNRAEAAVQRIQKLNNRVQVHANTASILEVLSMDPVAAFSPYDIIIATDLPYPILKQLNAATQMASRLFYAGGSHGYYGYIFADLMTHKFTIERAKSNRETELGPETSTRSVISAATKRGDDGKMMEVVEKQEIYSHISLANTSPLSADILSNRRRKARVTPLVALFRTLWEFEDKAGRHPNIANTADIVAFGETAKDQQLLLQLPTNSIPGDTLKDFLRGLNEQEVPVTAFLGGILAQDVIYVLGKKQQPIQNFLFFDGWSMDAPVYAFHPDKGLAVEAAAANGLMPVDPTAMPMAPAPMPMNDAIALD